MERATYLQHINDNMSVFDKFIGLLAPHDCLGCGAEGALLCDLCIAQLPLSEVPKQPASHLDNIKSATLYQGVAKDLIWSLKSNGAQESARIMAQQMAKLVSSHSNALIVPVPTATGRVRQRGYDQAKLLARHLSRLTTLPYANILARHGQAHQVGAHRHERLNQLQGALRVKKPAKAASKHIILIDDVMTTGATLETAARILRLAGARRVDALTYAYRPLDLAHNLQDPR
jgi:ComF family protein